MHCGLIGACDNKVSISAIPCCKHQLQTLATKWRASLYTWMAFFAFFVPLFCDFEADVTKQYSHIVIAPVMPASPKTWSSLLYNSMITHCNRLGCPFSFPSHQRIESWKQIALREYRWFSYLDHAVAVHELHGPHHPAFTPIVSSSHVRSVTHAVITSGGHRSNCGSDEARA